MQLKDPPRVIRALNGDPETAVTEVIDHLRTKFPQRLPLCRYLVFGITPDRPEVSEQGVKAGGPVSVIGYADLKNMTPEQQTSYIDAIEKSLADLRTFLASPEPESL